MAQAPLRRGPLLRGGGAACSLGTSALRPRLNHCCRAKREPAGDGFSLVSKNPLRTGAGFRARIALLLNHEDSGAGATEMEPERIG